MRGTVIYGPGDVRSEQLPEPKIIEPTDAIPEPKPFGHEYYRIVDQGFVEAMT